MLIDCVLVSDLKAAIANACHAVPSRTALSTQEYLRVEAVAAGGGALRIIGSCHEFSVSSTCPAEVLGAGVHYLHAKTLNAVLKPLSGCLTMIKNADESFSVRCKGQQIDLSTPSLVFHDPLCETPDYQRVFSAEAGALLRAMNHALFAVSAQSVRPQLCSLCLDACGEIVKVMASDGMQGVMQSLPSECTQKREILMPLPSAKALSQCLATIAPSSTVAVSAMPPKDWDKPEAPYSRACFAAQGVFLNTVLTVGRFPALETVIPKPSTVRATVSASALLAACAQLEPLAPGENHRGVLTIHTDAGVAVGIVTDGCTTKVPLATKGLHCLGHPWRVFVNLRLLKSFARAAGNSRCTIHLHTSDPLAAILILLEDEPSFRYCLMPLREVDS